MPEQGKRLSRGARCHQGQGGDNSADHQGADRRDIPMPETEAETHSQEGQGRQGPQRGRIQVLRPCGADADAYRAGAQVP